MELVGSRGGLLRRRLVDDLFLLLDARLVGHDVFASSSSITS